MDSAVVSQYLLDRIGERRVVAALFTTFTFEPEFFELEVIPLLLDSTQAYSNDDRVKRSMVREALRESDLSIDVYYDLPMYRATGTTSPEMEYGCHGVFHRSGAFHGKLNMLLLSDEDGENRALLVGAGSNNLTRAGWWDNIECQHWVELAPDAINFEFRSQLLADLDLLERHRLPDSTTDNATTSIRDYLNAAAPSQNSMPETYWGLAAAQQGKNFPAFLIGSANSISPGSQWHLEIISPFFADDPHNKEHEHFLQLGVQSITMLLPTDDENSALCAEAYYREVTAHPALQWARWSDPIQKSLGITNSHYRPLHAKVYHLYNETVSCLFVGSVNFTHKAMHDNIECGFLVPVNKGQKPLLQALEDKHTPHHFIEPAEQVPGLSSESLDDYHFPVVQLSYDWLNKSLQGRTDMDQHVTIEILGTEGHPVTEKWELTPRLITYKGDTGALEASLRHGALVQIRGSWLSGEFAGSSFPAHRMLIQEKDWSHKPLDLPALSAAQIIAIYGGMSSERRRLLLASEKIRQLLLKHEAGQLSRTLESSEYTQFFSQYAEIFSAFRQLRERMFEALKKDKGEKELDYYLSGTGIDSLPTLVRKATDTDEDESLEGVSAYLLLLCIKELYDQTAFSGRPRVEDLRTELDHEINSLENSPRIMLKNDSTQRRQAFFKWFREQFFREYQPVQPPQP